MLSQMQENKQKQSARQFPSMAQSKAPQGPKGLMVTLSNGRKAKVPSLNAMNIPNTQSNLGNSQLPTEPETNLTGTQGGNREMVRRAFSGWEAGHLKPGDFLTSIEAAGFKVTPKARQMAYVSGGATFQALMKSLTGKEDYAAHLPQNHVNVQQVDPRKHGESSRFVVQKRRSLDVMSLGHDQFNEAANKTTAKSYTGSGHMPGYGKATGAGACMTIRAEKAPSYNAYNAVRGPRNEHAGSIQMAELAEKPETKATQDRLTKRMQAQKLAQDLTNGNIDEAMFGVGLSALGLKGDASAEAMKMCRDHKIGGNIAVSKLTRAITMQLA